MQTDRTAPSVAASVGDIRTLADSWRISLHAANLSEKHHRTPTQTRLTRSRDPLVERDADAGCFLTREHIDAWFADIATQARPRLSATGTRGLRVLPVGLRRGEITETPMPNMKPPLLPPVEVPILSEEQVRALLATCKGNTFEDRRDCAMIYTLVDAGLRVSEATGLRVEDEPTAARKQT